MNVCAILCRVFGHLIEYAGLGRAFTAGTTFVMRLITPNVEVDLVLMTTFGATVLLYAVSTGFNNYWTARKVFYGQVTRALPLPAITFFGADQHRALTLAAGLVIGPLGQLKMYLAQFSMQVSRW